MPKKFDYKKEFSKFKKRAQELIKDNDKLDEIIQKAEEKLKSVPKVGDMLSYIPVFIDMLKDYLSGEYNEIPTGTLMSVCAVLLYFLTPLDLIPDFIPLAGLLDDAGVIVASLTFIKSDLDIYKTWRKNRPIDVTAKPKKDPKKVIKQISSKKKPIKKKTEKSKK